MTSSAGKKIDGVRKKRTGEETRSFVGSRRDFSSSSSKSSLTVDFPSKKSQTFFSADTSRKKTRSYKGFFIRLILVSISLFFYFHIRDYSAKITVVPARDILSVEEKVVALPGPHNKPQMLAFDYIALTDVLSQEIEVTERREVEYKAKGTVTLFNDYSTEPQRLISGTRLESTSGRIFLTQHEAIIPGKTHEGSGKIEVAVEAEKGGPDYNIDNTDFSIPGFKESDLIDKYNGIYGLSTKNMEGGLRTFEPYLSEEQKAQFFAQLENEMKALLEENILQEKTEFVYLVDKSFHIILEEPELSFVEGSESKATLTQKGTIYGIALGQEQIKNYLVKNYTDYPEGELVEIEDINNIRFSLVEMSSVDITNPNAQYQLNLTVDAVVKRFIDKESLYAQLVGMSEQDAYSSLKNNDTIGSFVIKIRPFWRKKLPSSQDQITIITQML